MIGTSIQETFVLPSHGKVYGEEFDPHVTLRSMTTLEEMRRLSHGDSEYRIMSDIIDACITSKLPISSYDMCLGDYQFLLHKLRAVTYGKEYKMAYQCPNCGEVVSTTVDLDDLDVVEYDEEALGSMSLTLPVTEKKITLSMQTPRMLDEIKEKAKALKKKTKDQAVNYEILFATMSFISTVEGKTMDEPHLEQFVRDLPMKDVYAIIQKGDELNRKVGLDTSIIAICPECGYESVTQFRIQPEFFGPSVVV